MNKYTSRKFSTTREMMDYFILFKLYINAYVRINHVNILFSFPLCVFSVLDCKPLRVGGMSPLFFPSHQTLNIILLLTVD